MIRERLHSRKKGDRSPGKTAGPWLILLALLNIVMMNNIFAQITPGKNQVFIYGQITNNINGAPVENHVVYLCADTAYNPVFHYFKSMITDKDGFFYDTIYTETEKGSVNIFTHDIENNFYDTTVYFRFEWQETNNLLISFVVADSLPQVLYQADFKAQRDTTGNLPLRMHFKDCSNTGNVLSWKWEFGDGTISYDKDPVHDYAEPGVYLVTLTIKGMFSTTGEILESSITKIIRVFYKGYYHLGGQVFAGYFPIDLGIAYLYQITASNEISFIDSISFDTLGCYYFYQLIEGRYLIKADLHPDSYLLQSFIATYYGNSLFWKEADTILHECSNFNYDIQMRPCGQMSAGVGEISGIIAYGEETNGKSAPASNIQVLLLDSWHNPITGCHSLNNGVFEFGSLAFSAYLVHAEVTGKDTEPVEIILTPEKATVNDISITINSHSVQGSVPNGIHPITGSSPAISLYPNPAVDIVYVSTNGVQEGFYSLSIFNSGMQQVFHQENIRVSPDSEIAIPVADLPSGVYFLSFQSGKKQGVLRKFVREN
ncbi:MAG: T9SS type A sorting domain-containing protein [Bacteroidales bacterium]|nr:T9SS type A sorting domain-containing protein [Bacteroidales bacterium]